MLQEVYGALGSVDVALADFDRILFVHSVV